MLINSPLNSVREVIPLIEAGADCFFAGLNSEIIFNNNVGAPNRRAWKFANFNTLAELKKAVEIAHQHGKEINLTLNEHHYSETQTHHIIEFLADNNIFDGYIVADIGMALSLKKAFSDIRLIGSVGLHIMNSMAVKLFIELGLSEIILPRQMSLDEISHLTGLFPDINFECFILNGDCANIDGLCRFTHGLIVPERIVNGCEMMENFVVHPQTESARFLPNLKDYRNIMFNHCGICATKALQQMNVKKVKVVGRESPLLKKARDVFFAKKAMTLSHLEDEPYKEKLKSLFFRIYGFRCNDKCFYRGQHG